MVAFQQLFEVDWERARSWSELGGHQECRSVAAGQDNVNNRRASLANQMPQRGSRERQREQMAAGGAAHRKRAAEGGHGRP